MEQRTIELTGRFIPETLQNEDYAETGSKIYFMGIDKPFRMTKKSIIYAILADWHDRGKVQFGVIELENETRRTLAIYNKTIEGGSCDRYMRFLNADYWRGKVGFRCESVGNGIFQFVEGARK